MTSWIRFLVLAVAVFALPSCGDDSSPTAVPTPTPVPTPPPPRVVLQGNVALDVDFVQGAFFTTDRAGTIEAVVDYTFTNSLILVWIARGQCSFDQFVASQCDYAATSFAGSKPRRVSVTNAAAATYTLIVGNAGPQSESLSFQVVLSPSAAAAAGGDAGTSSARGEWLFRVPQELKGQTPN